MEIEETNELVVDSEELLRWEQLSERKMSEKNLRPTPRPQGSPKNTGTVESGEKAGFNKPQGLCWQAQDAGVQFVIVAARGQPPPTNALLPVCPKRPRLPETPHSLCCRES